MELIVTIACIIQVTESMEKLVEHNIASDKRGAQRIIADSCPAFGVIRNCEEPVNDMESPSPHRKRRTITWPMGTQAQ